MSTETATWHQFRDTYDGDDSCDSCAVVVGAEAHLTFTLPCPVPECPSRANPDAGCVFAPGRGDTSAMCVYCGRSGSRSGDLPPADAEMDAVVAGLLGFEPYPDEGDDPAT